MHRSTDPPLQRKHGEGDRMARRWSIPVATAVLALGVLGLAGNASAAPVGHDAAAHALPGAPGTRGFNPGGVMIGHHALHPGARGIRASQEDSENWSGYAVTGADGAFSSVSASWIQPAGTCKSSADGDYAAFWAGLDGFNSSSVEQTGTQIECSDGTAEYTAWYEMYPASPVTYSNTVKPGDAITASVTFSGTDTYTLVLKDATQGWTQTQVINESGLDRSSAEVITEAPAEEIGPFTYILPLANFGTVNYTGVSDNGSSMGTQSPTGIIIVSGTGTQEDSTSSITSSGNFSNTWLAAGGTLIF
jgi:hypothetical protein